MVVCLSHDDHVILEGCYISEDVGKGRLFQLRFGPLVGMQQGAIQGIIRWSQNCSIKLEGSWMGRGVSPTWEEKEMSAWT